MKRDLLSRMAGVAVSGLLARRDETAGSDLGFDVEKEGMAALQMCFKALDMNICVAEESLFETCLIKHVRPFFSSARGGRETAEVFVSLFIDYLREEGEGDLQLARMRTALYRSETLSSFSRLLKGQLEAAGEK
jgi:hypothetical protein